MLWLKIAPPCGPPHGSEPAAVFSIQVQLSHLQPTVSLSKLRCRKKSAAAGAHARCPWLSVTAPPLITARPPTKVTLTPVKLLLSETYSKPPPPPIGKALVCGPTTTFIMKTSMLRMRKRQLSVKSHCIPSGEGYGNMHSELGSAHRAEGLPAVDRLRRMVAASAAFGSDEALARQLRRQLRRR